MSDVQQPPDPAALFSVRGRKALVTGGRRGLGLAMAMGLARAGADVGIVSKSSVDPQTLERLRSFGTRIVSLQCDLLDAAARKGVCERVAEGLSGLDALINNAGLQSRAPLFEYGVETFQADQELMLTAPFDLAVQAGRIMVAQGRGGSIINISSISGFQGARGIAGYASAKHALIGLTKCLANELAPSGINVNCLAPGVFETDMAASVTQDPAKRREMLGRVPAGRFGEPNDLVGPLLFLLSPAARHVHGTTLAVDGGWLGR